MHMQTRLQCPSKESDSFSPWSEHVAPALVGGILGLTEGAVQVIARTYLRDSSSIRLKIGDLEDYPSQDTLQLLTSAKLDISTEGLTIAADLGFLTESIPCTADATYTKYVKLSLVREDATDDLSFWTDEFVDDGEHEFAAGPPEGYSLVAHLWNGSIEAGSSEVLEDYYGFANGR